MWFTTYYVIWPQLANVRQIFSPYAERRKWNEHCGYCITWYQFSSCFKPYGVKVLTFLIQKFSLSLNLNFSVSVGVVFIIRSFSIIINLPCLLNGCSLLLRCLHAYIAFGFFMSFLWLFSWYYMFQIFEHTESCTWCILVSRWDSYYGKWIDEKF